MAIKTAAIFAISFLLKIRFDILGEADELLYDFLLTVKAATLSFIFGHGSAILSAKQGKSGSIE